MLVVVVRISRQQRANILLVSFTIFSHTWLTIFDNGKLTASTKNSSACAARPILRHKYFWRTHFLNVNHVDADPSRKLVREKKNHHPCVPYKVSAVVHQSQHSIASKNYPPVARRKDPRFAMKLSTCGVVSLLLSVAVCSEAGLTRGTTASDDNPYTRILRHKGKGSAGDAGGTSSKSKSMGRSGKGKGKKGPFPVTLWAIIFHNPSACAAHPDPCSGSDLANPAADGAGFFTTGGVSDKDGNVLWNKVYGGSEDELASDIAKTSDGGFVISG